MALELETKFIEGTDNQYSIRNDGVVIRHFSIVSNQFITAKIVYKDKIIKKHLVDRKINPENKLPYVRVLLYIIGEEKKKECNVKVLVMKHFTDVKINTHTRITHKDNNVFNCSLDNLLIEKRQSNYLSLNRPLSMKERNTKNKIDISKGYVANQTGRLAKDLSNQEYEEYKILLQVKRLLAQKTNCSIHSLK